MSKQWQVPTYSKPDNTKRPPSNPTKISTQEYNARLARMRINRRNATIALLVTTSIMAIAVSRGLSTTVYENAEAYKGATQFFIAIIALSTGFYFANDTSKYAKGKKKYGTLPAFSAAGFIFGLIPGLIMATVLWYPLSVHACELSGSKYC